MPLFTAIQTHHPLPPLIRCHLQIFPPIVENLPSKTIHRQHWPEGSPPGPNHAQKTPVSLSLSFSNPNLTPISYWPRKGLAKNSAELSDCWSRGLGRCYRADCACRSGPGLPPYTPSTPSRFPSKFLPWREGGRRGRIMGKTWRWW